MLTKLYENTYFVRKKSHKLSVKQVYVFWSDLQKYCGKSIKCENGNIGLIKTYFVWCRFRTTCTPYHCLFEYFVKCDKSYGANACFFAELSHLLKCPIKHLYVCLISMFRLLLSTIIRKETCAIYRNYFVIFVVLIPYVLSQMSQMFWVRLRSPIFCLLPSLDCLFFSLTTKNFDNIFGYVLGFCGW